MFCCMSHMSDSTLLHLDKVLASRSVGGFFLLYSVTQMEFLHWIGTTKCSTAMSCLSRPGGVHAQSVEETVLEEANTT